MGRLVDDLMQQTDILPTLCDLVGLDIPAGVQGKSLKPLLISDQTDTGCEFVYIETISSGAIHPDYFDQQGEWTEQREQSRDTTDVFTIRNHKWQLTAFTGKPYGELYDLQADLYEFENRWDEPALQELRQELLSTLFDRMAGTRDPLPHKKALLIAPRSNG